MAVRYKCVKKDRFGNQVVVYTSTPCDQMSGMSNPSSISGTATRTKKTLDRVLRKFW